ncbi:hypothetical protein GL218_05244 [Daldinia childiae]|uniref:uncharacterized protein n=1 Tax=Daldinia childiae TaxID=326645 RepID=UPI0014450F49|nr:uncharacterized protein GL218_05244 [Daldinia childiae]KAF3058144.1 hypothetical protein GL218_05244 [Daldinia childiae]
MDSTSKPKSLENVPEDEENATDATAREIKSSGRPSDALKAIEYDIINILWRDPKHPEFPHNLVIDKLHVFADYVINLWSKSKDLKSKVDDAKKKNDQAKATSLKADLDATYDTIRVAIEAAIMFGDRFTLTQIGIHTKFLGNLSILLRTLFVAEDYNGRLPKAILKLLSLFVTVEVEFLKERVKLDRVRQKFKDNLDEESTDYMDQIFDNAKKRSALKAEETREDVKKNEDGKKAIQGPKKPSSMSNKDPVIAPSSKTPLSKNDALSKKNNAEIKRPIDYSSLGSARKVSSTAAKSSPSLTASKRPGDDGVDSRVPKKLAVENAAGAPSSAKTSSNVTPAIPQSSSANAQSRSRPSGSMLPGRSRSSAKVQPKKPVARQPASSAIGGLLAEINSEKPKQVKEPERAPETPEETEIRLRKEAKRKLHVTWKPDGELTEIRILEHDTAEDKGRDDNMLRDARDNRSEGQVLRESVQREKEGVDDAEEDEAREKTNGIALRKWTEPIPYSPAQKSRISQKRQEEMFTSRGGLRPVESKQNKVMEEYESRELMAIYTSFSEVPATPRSPTGRIAEIVTQPKIRALPSGPTQWNESLPAMKYAEIHRRWSDNINFGREMALVNALHRLKASRGPMNLPNVAARGRSGWDASIGRDNGSEVLALLQSDKVKNYVDPDPFDPARPKTRRRHDYGDPKVQADIDALEDTFAMFIGKQAPPNQPPMLQANASQQYQQLVQPQHVQAQQAQPQPQQQLPPEYLEALQKINALSAGQALQPSVQPPVAPSFQPNPVAQQPFFAALLQQSGILDALKIAPAPAYATPHAVPNVATNAASHAAPQGYWPDWSQNQPQIQPQTSQAYTGYGHNNQSFGSQSQHNQPQATQGQHDSNDRGNRRDFRGNREQKNINRSLIGTKPCSFWAKGQCAKGSNCTFRHDPNDLQDQGQN